MTSSSVITGVLLQKGYAIEYILIREGDVTLHLLPDVNYTPAKRHGLPPVCRSTFSTQKWRTWVYMPLSSHAGFPGYLSRQRWTQAKGRNSSGEDTAVQVEPGNHSPTRHYSLAIFGSWKEALTSCASFSWSSTSGTIVSSCHQLGVSHAQAFHVTHSSTLLLEAWGGCLHILLFWTFSWPLEEAGDLWP